MSLRQRLLLLVLGVVTLVWIGAAAFTYRDARHELDELLDAHLAQASTLLVAQFTHELDDVETEHAPLLHKYSSNIAFQVWEEGRKLLLHSANAPSVPLGVREQGFSNTRIDGQEWRVFSTWDGEGELLIHVAERVDMRSKLAREITGNLLLPLWIALPLLAALLWWTVAVSLRPLVSLTRAVASRNPDNLAPLTMTSAPHEVVPLIERLNHLFARIGKLIENERRFTADAAHELRTPIAAIKAQLQVAKGAQDDAEHQHALDNAILGCNRATHLIEQLLTLARLESADASSLQTCPLPRLAAEVMADMAPHALQSGVALELLESADINVKGLPALLQVMLRNLLDNAARYTPSGTLVQVAVFRARGRACLRITDNGPGLPADELEKITRRFYRPAGTAAEGSGLGLSIVQRIAEIHQAELQFEQNQGQGLSVLVVFPAG
ncbi:MAG: sensor histidine kinase N-terminal domain-containing protein [Gammaproteobacteria bacterium]|nr:sensor histidine kinase N-terminal domain-containing protein [Gammaproteobacteria bacterium]MBU1722407.1 sensor histidine kinase N-terminal domain-containing protein [Gammaproteobacteria bacterium]MBU2004656.1 sensor histidine kinase N-terminal domain-containing protein [Gammaproteobacteria bacterium]